MGNDSRHCFNLDPSELKRRWAFLDELMESRNLDALIVQGFCNAVGLGGYFMWLTGSSPHGSYPQTAIYWRNAPMTVIRHGAFGQTIKADADSAETFGIGEILGTPTFPAADYTLKYDAEIAAQALVSKRAQRIGLIAPGTMYHGFATVLSSALEGLELVDVTPQVDAFKAIKSNYEITLIRQAAQMQDAILHEVSDHIRPGLRDYEVMGLASAIGERNGSSGTGIFLGSSFPPGDKGLPVRHRAEQGRMIEEGDLFFLLIENAGGSGMYTHISRFFSLGKPPQELVDRTGEALEAQAYTCSLLVPGAQSADVFAQYNDYMEQRGLGKEARLHAHGQGLDLVERPLIRSDEDMAIARGMNIGVHPFIRGSGPIVTICDNFIIADSGAERLHAFPQMVVEIGNQGARA